MTKKESKTLGTLITGISLIAGLSFNSLGNFAEKQKIAKFANEDFSKFSYSQDTLKTADGYYIFNEKGQLIRDVKKGHNWEEIYDYDSNKGNLKELTTFSKGIKTRLYTYNDKRKLTKETIFDKEGKVKEIINHKL